MKQPICFLTLVILILGICSCSNPIDKNQNSESQLIAPGTNDSKLRTDLKENGHFVFEYMYNIALRQKKVAPCNIFLDKDGKTIKISEKADTWEYEIKDVVESSESTYSVNLYGGNLAFDDKENYRLTINNGVAQMERLSNNAKWWYVSESARRPFEKELENAGLVFHK